VDIPTSSAISLIISSSWGRNSWRGGSRSLMITGLGPAALKIYSKSSYYKTSSSSRAFFLYSGVNAQINLLKTLILSSSKNICSVLAKPIPSAPNSRAFLISGGSSALVLIYIYLYF